MKSTLLATGALALSLSPAFGALGLIADPSFEGDTLTFDGVPPGGELTTYEGFTNGPAVLYTTTNPRTGAQSLELTFAAQDNSFAGLFQDVSGIIPGETYNFSGFHARSADPQGFGVEIRIEWLNLSLAEVGRTGNLSPTLTTDYEPFSLDAAAPGDAAFARVVYAAQTFGGEPDPSNSGVAYVDDLAISGNFVPEPSTVLLGAFGLLGLLIHRRR